MNESNNKSIWVYITIIVFAIIIVGIIGAVFYYNQSKINQLTRTLQQTQKEVQDVKEETQEKKQDMVEEINPESVARLALLKAYATKLRSSLSQADLADIDRITLYVEGNPNVIITKNPNLPEDIIEAVTNIKLKAKAARNVAVATIKNQVDSKTYQQNELVTITGTIEFVEDDTVMGGSIFMLTDSETGNVFYLHFNESNSQSIKNTLVGENVSVDIRVTSKINEPLTFEVIKGPTLAATPTTSAMQVSPTPTQ